MTGITEPEEPQIAEWELSIYRRAGLSDDGARLWASRGIGPYQAEQYLRAGLDLREALRWHDAGLAGIEAAQCIEAKVPIEVAGAWKAEGFVAQDAIAAIRDGLSIYEAVQRRREEAERIALRKAAEAAAAEEERRRQEEERARIEREQAIDPLSREGLQEMETATLRDLAVGCLLLDLPETITPSRLVDRIIAELPVQDIRGRLLWADDGGRCHLYDVDRAARGRALVSLANSIVTWGDLRQAQAEEPEFAAQIEDCLWSRWDNHHYEEFGLTDEDVWGDGGSDRTRPATCDSREPETTAWQSISSFEELADAFADGDRCPVEVCYDDDATMTDGFDPYEMGVPDFIIDLYYYEGASMTGCWLECRSEDLPAIEALLRRVGWRLEEGALDDVCFP